MSDVMTIKEVAEYLKVSEITVRRMLARREIPAKKVGKQWRFLTSEIEEWLKKGSSQRDFLGWLFNGSMAELLNTLLEAEKISQEELQELKRLIDEKEGEGR